MSSDIQESKELRQLLEEKRQYFEKLSVEVVSLSTYVSDLQSQVETLTKELQTKEDTKQLKQREVDTLNDEVTRLHTERHALEILVDKHQVFLDSTTDAEEKNKQSLATLSDLQNQLAIRDNLLQEIKEKEEWLEDLFKRVDFYEAKLKEKQDLYHSKEDKIKQLETC